MGIGVSLILIAVGLVLALAVHANVQGVDVPTVGWILSAVGLVGLLVSLALWDRFNEPRSRNWRP